MQNFHKNQFYNFGECWWYHNENNNLKTLYNVFAQNRRFIILYVNGKVDQRERPKGFLERLKICPRPPEPPPRPPNKIEVILRQIHAEAVMATREILSASVASVFGIAAAQPFEVLKLKFLSKQFYGGPWYKIFTRRYRLIHEAKSILATKGFSRFYKGHVTAQRESLIQTISMFYTYQRCYQELEKLEKHFKDYPNLCVFFSGFISAAISVLLVRPYNTFRHQVENKRLLLQKWGPIPAAYTLRHKPKWYAVFKGCMGDFLYTGTQYGLRFLIYNRISEEILVRKPDNKRVLHEYFLSEDSKNSDFEPERPIKDLTYFEALFAGAVSGVVSDVTTHPLDVVNERLKVHALARQSHYFEDTCRRYGQCFRVIWRQQRLKGFYPGFVPSLLKSCVYSAVTFAVYDTIQQLLRQTILTS